MALERKSEEPLWFKPRTPGSTVAPMEKMFARSVEDASKLIKLTEDDYKLFERVEKACDELVLPEFEKYLERKFNDKTPEIIKKHDLMGIPISRKYGGGGGRPLGPPPTLPRGRPAGPRG